MREGDVVSGKFGVFADLLSDSSMPDLQIRFTVAILMIQFSFTAMLTTNSAPMGLVWQFTMGIMVCMGSRHWLSLRANWGEQLIMACVWHKATTNTVKPQRHART